MKKYMLVCRAEGEQFAAFADTFPEARQMHMDIECGLGGYCEVYERTTDEDGLEQYVLLYA